MDGGIKLCNFHARFEFKNTRDIFAKKCYNDKILVIEDLPMGSIGTTVNGSFLLLWQGMA